MAVHRLPSGAVVIDDAYNANPTSMAAALDALVAIPASRRIAVVGLMAELDEPAAAHRSVADRAAEQGIELIAVGTDLYGVDAERRPDRRRRCSSARARRCSSRRVASPASTVSPPRSLTASAPP